MKDILEKVSDVYNEHDWHYLGEEISEKINLYLWNDGEKYLEDVSIVLYIPAESVIVMDKIHDEPRSNHGFISYPSVAGTLISSYPYVTKNENDFYVEVDIGELKHQQYIKAFEEDLRVLFLPRSVDQKIEWSYTIYAKNLPRPLNGILELEVN